MWEQECNAKLLSERQKERDTHFILFERKALIQTDTKTESDLIIAEFNNGLLSWEECRQLLNRTSKQDKTQTWRIPTFVTDQEENDKNTSKEEQEDSDIKEDEETKNKATDKALRGITEEILTSLIKRCEKSVQNGNTSLIKHRPIMLQKLSVYRNSEELIDGLLQELQEEIDATLPEQRKEAFKRVDIKEITEALCI